MNKTIIININGIVFHIEEDAYDVLKVYMTDVKRHFSTSADSLEITTDIENRIAEMFNEILASQSKQVIVEQDVKLVVEQMGTVEDFEFAEDDAKNTGPANFAYNTERRRLFRDPDDHLVSGVCAGIANYFDIPAVWIRLAFVLSFCVVGSGFFLYIILWMVIPKAITRADRMAMKGEKQDLKGFKKNFEDELSSVKENLHNFKHEAKPFVYKTRDFISDFFDHFFNFLRGAGGFVGKLIAGAILLVCFGMAVALIVVLVSFIAFGKNDIFHIPPFNLVNQETSMIFLTGAFLLLAIPLLSIILVVIGFLFKNASFNRTIGTTLLCVWLAALGAVVYYSVKASTDFKAGAKINNAVGVKATANNTYYLELNDTKYLSKEDSIRLKIKERFNGMVILDDDYNGDDFGFSDPVSISIEKADIAQPSMTESFVSRGHDYEDALINTRNISYRFIQKDSVLKFNRHMELADGAKWRGQKVYVTLRLPLNATVVIDGKLDRNLSMNLWDCENQNKPSKPNHSIFTMTTNGLECKIPPVPQATIDSLKKEALIDSIRNAGQ